MQVSPLETALTYVVPWETATKGQRNIDRAGYLLR